MLPLKVTVRFKSEIKIFTGFQFQDLSRILQESVTPATSNTYQLLF